MVRVSVSPQILTPPAKPNRLPPLPAHQWAERAQADALVSISQEAKKQLARTGRDPGKRIAEAQTKLQELLKRMQRAALMGDKRAAAAIAKEAAGLAKELSAAIKAAKADATGGVSGAALTLNPTMPAEPMAPVASSEVELAGATQEAPDQGGASTKADSEKGTAASLAGLAANSKAGSVEAALVKEVNKAMLTVRSILAMAKATLKRKGAASRSGKKNDSQAQDFQKEIAAAERDVDEAVASIQADTMPNAALGLPAAPAASSSPA